MAMADMENDGLVASINVTPLVDVMLVLLVIFMVTAPILQQGVEVDLPKAESGPLKGSEEQIVVSVAADGKIYLGAGNAISLEELGPKLKAVVETRAKGLGEKINVKADKNIAYGTIMDVLSQLYTNGLTNFGLVTEPANIKSK